MSSKLSQVRVAWPPLQRPVLVLGATLLALRLLMVAAAPLKAFALTELVLHAQSLPSLKLWAVLTHALWSTSFGALFFDLFALYLFGAEVLRDWGLKRWSLALGLGALLGGLLGALSLWAMPGPQPPLGGMGAATMALVAGYCHQRWDQTLSMIVFELKGKALLGLFIALDLLMTVFSGSPTTLLWHLGGVAAGLIVAAQLYSPRRLILHLKYWKIRRNLKVIARTPEADARDARRRNDGQWIN